MDKAARTLRLVEMLLALLEGHTNLTDAARILSGRSIEKPVRETAEKLMAVLKTGRSFAEGFAAAAQGTLLFPPLYAQMLRSAEQTGAVDKALAHIAEHLRRKIKARETVVAALVYPAAVVFIALAGTVVLLWKGLPLFAGAGMLPEEYLARAQSSVVFAGVFLLASGAAAAFACYRLIARESPPFRIFYELSFLLAEKVPLPDALTSCIMSMGTTKWGRALARAKRDITAGGHLARAFTDSGVFPAYITGWLAVGDRNGEIETACRHIAEYYRDRDGRRSAAVMRFAEPLFIVITGAYLVMLIQGVILPVLTRAGGLL
jgi:type II secretory pathway component PulF